MSSINAVPGISWPAPTAGVGAPGAASSPAASGASNFADVLTNAFEKVNTQQQNSDQAIQDLITGKSTDALPVVEAAAKADLSFKLLLGVRNKVIEAYKQTLNMQI